MVTIDKKFLHISIISSGILALITPGIVGVLCAFTFGTLLGQGLRQERRRRKNG